MKRILTNKRHIVLFSLLLFMAMQYSALLHASTHYFHTHDSLCTISSAVDHSKADVVEHNISLAVIPSQSEPAVHDQRIAATAYFIILPSRAPPRP